VNASRQCSGACCTSGDGLLDPEGAHLAALRRLGDFAGARVCEVGCGDGRLTTGIAEEAATVFAFDPDRDRIAEARRRLPRDLRDAVRYEVGSAREIRIPPGEFDLVVFSWSLCCMGQQDVVHVLRRFRRALVPGGAILDLQVIAPEPAVEVNGKVLCRLEGGTLLEDAAAAAAAVDREIVRGLLHQEAVDDHHVLRHFPTGASLVEHFRPRPRSVPTGFVPLLEASARPHIVREACRFRRLRRTA
jgi:SAM-dependent methyltransferase